MSAGSYGKLTQDESTGNVSKAKIETLRLFTSVPSAMPYFLPRPASFRLSGYCDQAISPPRPVTPVKQRKQERAASQHQSENQQRIPQLPRRLPRAGKEPGNDRRGYPQCRCDLPDLYLPEPALVEQMPQGQRREMRDVKGDVPVNPPAPKHRTQPALAVGTADPNFALRLQHPA